MPGYARSVQRKADSIITSNPNVRQAFEYILNVAGITDAMLAKRAFEGLNATIILRETKYSKAQIVVNFTERREMLELILRAKGLLVNKHQVDSGPTLAELLEESWKEPEYTDEEVQAIVEAHEQRKREKRNAATTTESQNENVTTDEGTRFLTSPGWR